MKYRNITISGLPGAGSTTLAKNLALKLGWQYVSLGEEMREYAIKQGLMDKSKLIHHDATIYGEGFDRQVDRATREKLQSGEGQIVEGWLAGFMAQGMKGTLKVLVICGEAERARRIAKRDKIDQVAAERLNLERKEKSLAKWQQMYEREWQEWVGEDGIDFWREDLYDVVIDTHRWDQKQARDKVMKELNA